MTTDTDSDYYVPNAIKDDSGSCYDYVYVSLGANDQMNTECQESGLEIVKTRITSVLAQVWAQNNQGYRLYMSNFLLIVRRV